MTAAALRFRFGVLPFVLVVACGGGDDDGDDDVTCDDGDMRACDCPGGGDGVQLCIDGEFGTCTGCGGGGPDAGGADAAGAIDAAPELDAFVPGAEACDGVNNDLDGAIDEWESPGNVNCMVAVAAGTFTMGCDPEAELDCPADAQPPHAVTLDAFEIDRTEVTQAAYGACVDAGACMAPTGPPEEFDPVGLADRPVIWVNWQRALAYCSWAGKRLPTEAEWERAARGTDGRRFPWGATEATCERAAHESCAGETARVVGGGGDDGDSPAGAHDMAGNVAEWVIDFYAADYYASEIEWDNPIGPAAGTQRGQRGGRWDGAAALLATWARAAAAPGAAGDALGFRCARPGAE